MTEDNFEDEVAELWESASERLIDKHRYVNRLEELLRAHGITEESFMMDVAGGFGFPLIDLAKRGYQIVYNDGSWSMFRRAFANAEKAGAPLYPFQAALHGSNWGGGFWQDLKDFQPDAWDALICTGNSLPYAVSWGKGNPDLSEARSAIVETLSTFYRIIKPDGFLYVDKQPEKQDHDEESVGRVTFRDQEVELVSIFDNDKVNRIRNWTLETREPDSGRVIEQFPSRGYLLLEDELLSMLEEAGFRDTKKQVLEGDIYEGFVAVK